MLLNGGVLTCPRVNCDELDRYMAFKTLFRLYWPNITYILRAAWHGHPGEVRRDSSTFHSMTRETGPLLELKMRTNHCFRSIFLVFATPIILVRFHRKAYTENGRERR